MIYFFTGNSQYLLREQVSKWKTHFLSKYGDINLLHLKNISEYDNNFLLENLATYNLFSEKKLIIIENIPLSSAEKDKKLSQKQEYLESILDKIVDENIILFASINPDKRGKLYKKLKKEAETKEFNIKNDNDTKNILEKKYQNKINYSAINTIIKYKSGNFDKIVSELEKLFIKHDKIDSDIIKKYIFPELEESIFIIIDLILSKDFIGTIKNLRIIFEQSSSYAVYNNLLANLRTSVYISTLKSLNIPNGKITEDLNLGNRSFLVTKNYKIANTELSKLYIDILNLDKTMKSGKLIGTEESDFKNELEKILLTNIDN